MRFTFGGFDKHRLVRIVGVVAVALAAGHLVQTMADKKPQRALQSAEESRPVGVVQLAATSEPVKLPPLVKAPQLPATTLVPTAPTPALVEQADPCNMTLDLMVDPGAMIGLTLLAPCHPAERLVISHGGLSFTVVTMATGSVFLSLPALATDAVVEARFADGTEVSGSVMVPDLAAVRRFGVQWQGDDAFQVYGMQPDGTVSATNPGIRPSVQTPLSGGFMNRLGDAAATLPLLAEIYTFPASSPAEVVIEAAVTSATCGREILGETLALVAGSVTVTELSLVMPECTAVGDFLVLNNLASDLTLAAAN